MSTIFHLLYSSFAASFVSEKTIEDILTASRANNSQAQVTGLLVYRSGHFLQVLEGAEPNVRQIYQVIQADRRHRDHKVLTEFTSEKRIFPQWSMGVIQDKQLSASILSEINEALSAPVENQDDMKSQVIQVFRKIAQTEIG